MLLLIWFLTQLVVVLAMAVLGPHLPQSPLEIVVLLVLGTTFLIPLLDRLFPGALRWVKVAPLGPPPTSRPRSVVAVAPPAAPGTPGTPLVRAPARPTGRRAPRPA